MNWIEANQQYLTAALAEVRAQLEKHGGEHGAGGPDPLPPGGDDIPAFEPPAQPAIEILCLRFRLSPFERAILLLCAGVELDSSLAALCASVQAANLRHPTFSLALAALPGAHWSAVTPEGPLRRWKLMDMHEGTTPTVVGAALTIDERILHFLTGIQQLDQRLLGAVQDVERDAQPLVPSHAAIAHRIAAAVGASGAVPVIQLCGTDPAECRAVAAAAAGELRLHLLQLDADAVPQSPAEVEAFVTLCDREAALSGSGFYVEASEIDGGDARAVRNITRIADRIAAPLFLGTRERWRTLRKPIRTFDVGRPTSEEQLTAWRAALGEAGVSMNGDLHRIATQFDLTAAGIRAAAQEALESASDDAALGALIWRAGAAAARPHLESLAQRIEVASTREDLVLSPAELEQLDQIAIHVAHRATVYGRWGFGRSSRRGLGISALFSGASGTGKTLAAEVLASELQLDLYRIDLSSVVNKYIGETEKNLRRVFDAAESGGAILFFDEADALFGKRGEVRDSHDRYANIEINYLLQRMESYRGLAVLATNRKADLDPAFLRRIRFIVNFPFPDQVMRHEIWKRIFPRELPLDSVDFGRLSRMSLSGGSIRNIAMGAAFLAAADGRPVAMDHLQAAAQREHAKLERPLMEGP